MKYFVCILFFATFFSCSLFQSQQGNKVERDFIENIYYKNMFDRTKIKIEYKGEDFVDTSKILQYLEEFDTEIILCNFTKDTISSEDSLYADNSLDEVEYAFFRNYYYKIIETKYFIKFQFSTYKDDIYLFYFDIFESESCIDSNSKSIIYKPVDSHPYEPY